MVAAHEEDQTAFLVEVTAAITIIPETETRNIIDAAVQ